MDAMERLEGPRGGTVFGRGLLQLLGWAAAGCAAVVAAGLAVVFAASVFVIGLMASVLIAFTAVAMRARRTARVHAYARPQHLQARQVGHSWVAYSWDRR